MLFNGPHVYRWNIIRFLHFSQKRGELYLLMKLPEAGASVSTFSLKVKLAVFNSDHDVIITAY